MKLLKTIRDADLGLGFLISNTFGERKVARAVVFDRDNNVALLNVKRKKYHKLPGGGVEAGEDMKIALARELSEEIGCEAEIVSELGMIEEYRNKDPYKGEIGLHQISYCYIATLIGEKGVPHLEEGEIADGFETEWMSLDIAIKTLERELQVEDYEGKFIALRDFTFLTEVANNA